MLDSKDRSTYIPVYCTSTNFHNLFNFTIFSDPEDVLKLICVKYYGIGINLDINATSVKLHLCKYFKMY